MLKRNNEIVPAKDRSITPAGDLNMNDLASALLNQAKADGVELTGDGGLLTL